MPSGMSALVRLRASARVHHVFLFAIGKPFVRALVPALFAIVFGIAMADAVVDWGALRRRVASLPPWLCAIEITVLMLAWSIVAGRALKPVWQTPLIGFVVRQPMSRRRWAAYLVPSVSIAFVPVAAIWWLAPRSVTPIVHYAGFVGLAWPMILGASGSGVRPVALAAAGSCILAVLILAYLHYPWVAYAAMLVTLAELPAGVALIPAEIGRPSDRISGNLAGAHPIVVIARRDLRCLFREDGKRLLGAWGLGLVAAAMMLAFRVNGGVAGREAFDSACMFVTIAAVPVYESLAVIKLQLGREVMRRRWPLTYAQRGGALVVLIAAFIGPAATLIFAFGSTMGVAYQLVYLIFAASVAMLAAAFFAARLVVDRSEVAWFHVMLLCHALLALALPAGAYAVLGAAVVASSPALIVRGLRAFSDKVEGAGEQAA
jgi:hypothetical protein